jgi:hypothetical protein
MRYLDLLPSYRIITPGVQTHEKYELDEVTIATVSDIEMRIRLEEETRQSISGLRHAVGCQRRTVQLNA